MAVAPLIREELTLERLAAEAVELHPEDRNEASEHFARRLRDMPRLQWQADVRLGRLLVNEVIRALHFATMRRDLPRIAAEVRESMGGILHSWRLSNNKSLFDATRVDLQAELRALRGMLAGVQARITFLESLLARLQTDADTVGDRFSEEEVSEAFATAKGTGA